VRLVDSLIPDICWHGLGSHLREEDVVHIPAEYLQRLGSIHLESVLVNVAIAGRVRTCLTAGKTRVFVAGSPRRDITVQDSISAVDAVNIF
jgi:hypothetical protein